MVADPFITKLSLCGHAQLKLVCFLLSNEEWKWPSNRRQNVFFIYGICWFQRVNLELIVADYDRIGSSDPIGKVLLGYNRKSLELKHWKEMIENPRRPIVHWHVLKVRIVSHIFPKAKSDLNAWHMLTKFNHIQVEAPEIHPCVIWCHCGNVQELLFWKTKALIVSHTFQKSEVTWSKTEHKENAILDKVFTYPFSRLWLIFFWN